MTAAGLSLSCRDDAWAAVAEELAREALERTFMLGRSNGKVDADYEAAHALLDYRHRLLKAALAREGDPEPPGSEVLLPARARAVNFRRSTSHI